jgi:SpoIIAA-like
MFELIDGFPAGTVAIRATGTVTADDYKAVLAPAVTAATADGAKARLLLVMGEGFEGYDTSAMLADTSLGIGHLGSFERIAVVTDADWLRRAIHLFGGFIPGEVRLFSTSAEGDATAWIGS